MSGLTKTFIVLLVVLSLVLSAGLIVFVNRTENFRQDAADKSATLSRAQTQLGLAKAEANAWKTAADQARSQRDAAIADTAKQVATKDDEITQLKTQNSTLDSNLKMAQVTADGLTATVNASEAVRKGLSDTLVATRTDLDTAVHRESDLNMAISDLTNKLDVATRTNTDLKEQLAEATAKNDTLAAKVKDLGGSNVTDATSGLKGGAPPINGVVLATKSLNGIDTATINVGTNAQVKQGMVFHVIDRDRALYLGDLTVETVDQESATGKLEGPHVGDVHAGVEVRTQL